MTTHLLAIESATDLVGCAVANSAGVMASNSVVEGRRHGELLAPLVEQTMAQSGLAGSVVDCVAVDLGPGLYTGLRVGIVTAASLAYAWDVPVMGIASTEVLAFGFRDFDGLVVPVIDARRSEAFFAAYRCGSCNSGEFGALAGPSGLDRALEVQVGSLDALEQALLSLPGDVPKLLVGNGIAGSGVDRLVERLELEASFAAGIASQSALPAPEVLAELAVAEFDSGRFKGQAATELRPMYLRSPDIGPSPAQP